ncbi:hypothetical protein [Planctomyces sp. SH-PL14]|uniref:hypothetical protein n=1 Tax=Planctomyces sp. SH-PL14 TaxID=1632864 RepID=UPI00078CF89C|nr:hypothetical protein [Planctomyces sp. SH-PL14]AMV19357.1 hypothetical protein VT03_15805 [Planctomyces sp. SH-PL14]
MSEPTSSLQFEARDVYFEDIRFQGHLWKLWIDGELVSEDAEPFDAASNRLTLSQCDYCRHCGARDIAVRRLDEIILWIDAADPIWPNGRFAAHDFRAFTAADYESALAGESRELPKLSSAELLRLVAAQTFPSWTSAFYRIPDSHADPHGQVLLQAINRAERDNFAGLTAHASAESIATIRIGLEEPSDAETVLELGRVATGRTVIRIRQNPALPFWISSDGLSGELDRYLAAHRSGPTAD